MNKKIYLYINGLSDLGSRMHLIAFSAIIFTFENSLLWLSLFFIVRQVGAILFSNVSGMLADRFDRRKLMMLSDICCGTAIALVLLFPNPITVTVSAFINGALYTLFSVSFDASLPDMFPMKEIVGINALVIRLTSTAGIIGFTVGGILADQIGYQSVILFDAATFFMSAMTLYFMRWNSKPSLMQTRFTFFSDIKEGIVYVRQNKFFLLPLALVLLCSFSASGYSYGLPLLSKSEPSFGASFHGLMWSTFGLGALIGSFWRSKETPGNAPSLLYSTVVAFLIIIAVFSVSHWLFILALLFMAGFADAQRQLNSTTMIQQSESHVRGRVFGLQAFLSRLGMMIGFVAAPVLTSQWNMLGMIIFLNGITIIAVIIIALYAMFQRKIGLGQEIE